MRGKEERMGKSEKNEKGKGEREKGKRRNKRTKRRRSKEGVRVLSLWRPLKSLVKGRDVWRVVVICLGVDSLEKHEDLSDYESDSCAHVRVVPEVTDVLVSLSSVVTEFCEVSACCSDWEDVVPQSFSFCKMRAFWLCKCAGRDEV